MISAEQNEKLSKVGPGTPMGALMRRYWHPIAASGQVSARQPTKEVRILGEDLVLYRDLRGNLGLIGPRCAHRNTSLSYAVPEENGLRCCYHGWLYDKTGQCIEQPGEPRSDQFKSKIKIAGYPVQEMGGLVFAYLGPQPVPQLPRWDVLAWDNATRKVSFVVLPCNWLQCMENSLDPVHFEWLHRYYGTYEIIRQTPDRGMDQWDSATAKRGRHHVKIGFELTDYGVIKRRLLDGETEADDHWRVGHPILFPNVLRVGQENWHGLHYRVPIDDTQTLHIMCDLQLPAPGTQVERQETVPFVEWPLYDKDGKIARDHVVAQDQVAWIIQGAITDRTTEHLGATDTGIVWYRNLLNKQMEVVANGGEPMNVHRDVGRNDVVVLPQEFSRYPGDGPGELGGPFKDYVPRKPDLEKSFV